VRERERKNRGVGREGREGYGMKREEKSLGRE